MFQFNARVICGRILISLPKFKLTEPQTRRTYLYLSIFTFEETLPITPEIVCGPQKQGKRFFIKALIYLMMMMMMMMMIVIIIIIIIVIIIIINYITFKQERMS